MNDNTYIALDYDMFQTFGYIVYTETREENLYGVSPWYKRCWER